MNVCIEEVDWKNTRGHVSNYADDNKKSLAGTDREDDDMLM
jgi:hypothetical protein